MPKIKRVREPGEVQLRNFRTPERHENYMIKIAMDEVQRRILEGTASAMETTHFLKLATQKSKLEQENMNLQNQLTQAKTEKIASEKKSEELYQSAIKAFAVYSGKQMGEEDVFDD